MNECLIGLLFLSFRLPLANRSYIKTTGLRSTVAWAMASLAQIQVITHSCSMCLLLYSLYIYDLTICSLLCMYVNKMVLLNYANTLLDSINCNLTFCMMEYTLMHTGQTGMPYYWVIVTLSHSHTVWMTNIIYCMLSPFCPVRFLCGRPNVWGGNHLNRSSTGTQGQDRKCRIYCLLM